MAVVNRSSVLSKAEACMKTPEKKKEIQKVIDSRIVDGVGSRGSGGFDANNVSRAANRFVEILKECINECAGSNFSDGDLGDTAIKALSNITIGLVGESSEKNCYTVPIYFSGDRHRDSLMPDEFDGVDDIVILLNNGYPDDGHEMGVVHGVWHGKHISNLRDRQGAHFIESAVHKFVTSEAQKYGVKDIKVNIANYKEYY